MSNSYELLSKIAEFMPFILSTSNGEPNPKINWMRIVEVVIVLVVLVMLLKQEVASIKQQMYHDAVTFKSQIDEVKRTMEDNVKEVKNEIKEIRKDLYTPHSSANRESIDQLMKQRKPHRGLR